MPADQQPSSSSRGVRLWEPPKECRAQRPEGPVFGPRQKKPLSSSEKRKEKREQLAAEKAAAQAAEFTAVLSSAAQNFIHYLEEKLQADRSPELAARFAHAAKIFVGNVKFKKFKWEDWQACVPKDHASAQVLGSWTPGFLRSLANYGIETVKPSQYAILVRALTQQDVEMLRADQTLLESFRASLQQALSSPQLVR